MGTYFPPLNLTLDADERTVKRAYAAALKDTRPDADPAAFQALVDARDRALAWVRRRQEMPALTDELLALRPGSGSGSVAVPTTVAIAVADPIIEPPIDETTDDVTAEDAKRVLREILAHVEDHPPPEDLFNAPAPQVLGMAFMDTPAAVRPSAASRADLVLIALDLIRRDAGGLEPDTETAWAQLVTAGEDLDLAGRLALERVIVVTLDATFADPPDNDVDPAARFARTILVLDRGFRWSDDMRRVVRILGEPAGTHPLVFAIERFGERAVRLRFSPSDFPLVPDSDLAAWYGSHKHGGVTAYHKARARDRFGLTWSWYAFLSPPAFLVSIGATIPAVVVTMAAVAILHFYFDPVANLWQADGFCAFLAVILAGRIGFAVAARSLDIANLVRRISRIEANGLPPITDRRRRVAAGRGSSLLNITCGLIFLLLVDGYWLSLVFPALTLSDRMVAEMIVVPDRKTPGVTLADRLTAQSYIDHAREIAGSLDDLIRDAGGVNGNAIALARAQALKDRFLARIRQEPIGEYAADFDGFRAAIAEAKRRRPPLANP